MKIFLSHPSRLKSQVRDLTQRLPSFLKFWLDSERLCWGDNLETSLRDAIQIQSDFVIIFLDQTALSSEWVRRELDWALDRERVGTPFLLPIIISSVDDNTLPDAIRNRIHLRITNFAEWSVSATAAEISSQLFQLVIKRSSLQTSEVETLLTLLVRSQKLSRAKEVAQLWHGFIIQDSHAPGTPHIISAEMSLQPAGNTYAGEMKYGIHTLSVNVETTLELQFLSAIERSFVGHYANRRPEATHFGSMMLQLDFDGQRFDGGYVGIGNINRMLTRGRILLTSASDSPRIAFADELKAYHDVPDSL